MACEAYEQKSDPGGSAKKHSHLSCSIAEVSQGNKEGVVPEYSLSISFIAIFLTTVDSNMYNT